MKQLEMKLILEGEELDTFMEIALEIQNHLKTLANQQTKEEEDKDQ